MYIRILCEFDNFIGNQDYIPGPTFATIPAGETELVIPITIIDNRNLENNKLFRVFVYPPEQSIHQGPCFNTTDVIIDDNDGKCLYRHT